MTQAELATELEVRLREDVHRWRPGAELAALEPLTGGASSLTFVASVTGAEADRVVVKVAPPGLAPVRNRDVLRQARLMRALHGTGVRVPRVLFEDGGQPPAVPPYLAMDLLPGQCVEPVLEPVATRPAPEEVRSRYLEATRELARLHALRPESIGLGDEPVVSLEDEIERWVRAFATVPEGLQAGHGDAARLLLDSLPDALPAVISHGDYRLGNLLCRGADIEAVIDWEIWSVTDPRIDVTWLIFFTDEAAHPAAEPGEPAGTPTKAEVIACYEEAAGAELPDMLWFDALTKFKEAAATALLLKRGLRGGPLSPPMERMVNGVPRLLSEVREALG